MNTKLLSISLVLISIIALGSCKPKQSAYKSVYEAAKEREMQDNMQSTNKGSSASTATTPSKSAQTSQETVRKEKITPVYESDAAGLKPYNVVIAAMSMKPNAESLKQRIENEGYKIILVQNEQGMYRVIIASCDTKDQAILRKNEILANFAEKGSPESLRAKYGIPFNDWWILQREY